MQYERKISFVLLRMSKDVTKIYIFIDLHELKRLIFLNNTSVKIRTILNRVKLNLITF